MEGDDDNQQKATRERPARNGVPMIDDRVRHD
jgi:hypothetical protein